MMILKTALCIIAAVVIASIVIAYRTAIPEEELYKDDGK